MLVTDIEKYTNLEKIFNNGSPFFPPLLLNVKSVMRKLDYLVLTYMPNFLSSACKSSNRPPRSTFTQKITANQHI